MRQTLEIPGQLFQFNNPAILSEYTIPEYLQKLVDIQGKNINFLIISGPSGVGKSMAISLLNKNLMEGVYWEIASRVSTRMQRSLEYSSELSFVTEEEFEKLKQSNQLLYSEQYGGNLAKYGVLHDELVRIIKTNPANKMIVITGTFALSKILPNCYYIYLLPPSLVDLIQRLRNSQKPESDKLLFYDILEMRSLIKAVNNQTFTHQNISIIINENEREKECASKIAHIATSHQQALEYPPNLVSELEEMSSNGMS